eukprot:scaffold3656_cov254-Pinguiococcus_pyrenoidosus.AAC.8
MLLAALAWIQLRETLTQQGCRGHGQKKAGWQRHPKMKPLYWGHQPQREDFGTGRYPSSKTKAASTCAPWPGAGTAVLQRCPDKAAIILSVQH